MNLKRYIVSFIYIPFAGHPSIYAGPETASPRTNTATAKMIAATTPTSRNIAPVSLSVSSKFLSN